MAAAAAAAVATVETAVATVEPATAARQHGHPAATEQHSSCLAASLATCSCCSHTVGPSCNVSLHQLSTGSLKQAPMHWRTSSLA
jgi:hypothetical protein